MKRIKLFNGLLFLCSFSFFSYLFYIQCIKHRYYTNIAQQEHQKKIILCATRGNIYDRNGLALATSEACYSIFCTPRYIRNKNLARELATISQKPVEDIKNLIAKNNFFWVEIKVALEKKDRYLRINDPGIGFAHDLNRHYNMPEIFSSLIGKCSIDNQGIEGLESYFNDILSGKSGFVVYQKEPTGEIFPYYNYPEVKPEPGQDIYLTVDLQLQTILYANLKDYLVKEEAKLAAGLIINPKTGEILALVNIAEDGDQRNHIICDEFEPGSTFKLLTLTYALLTGYKEKDIINTEGGKIKVGGWTIHDYKNYGLITLRQAIAHSSNVAMVKLSKKFDRENFFLLIRDFGFTQPTGIEFPGETKGRLAEPKEMNEVEFANLVFGQGITCNFLQLSFAYQTIANEGILNKPLIIRETRGKNKISYEARPLRVRRVVDRDIAERVTDVLCSVVEQGSGKEAKLEDIKIAGKTGTAQKVVDGQYSNSQVITTFIGYFPAEEPEYLIALMIDGPKKSRWASTITAPIFKSIVQSICQMSAVRYAVK